MERKVISEESEYQGEEKEGKKSGFGILFVVGGRGNGNIFEGEF